MRGRIGNGDDRERVYARHVPERRCLGCAGRAPKAALARFAAVRAPDGGRDLVRDDPGAHPGRGLYVCRDRACFARAVARGAFRRAARLGGEVLRIDPALADSFGERSLRG